MVDQDAFLLEGYVRQNVVLWDSSIDESAIHQALKDAQITRMSHSARRPE